MSKEKGNSKIRKIGLKVIILLIGLLLSIIFHFSSIGLYSFLFGEANLNFKVIISLIILGLFIVCALLRFTRDYFRPLMKVILASSLIVSSTSVFLVIFHKKGWIVLLSLILSIIIFSVAVIKLTNKKRKHDIFAMLIISVLFTYVSWNRLDTLAKEIIPKSPHFEIEDGL